MRAFDRLLIARAKLVDYLLKLDHPSGGSKARFFVARGSARDQPDALARALHAHARSQCSAIFVVAGLDGRNERRMVVDGPLACPDGSEVIVRAVWRFEEGSDVVTFVTAYPARRTARS